MKRYKEHEKLQAVKDKSQEIGDFLEWCNNKGIFLGEYDRFDELVPIRKNTETMLAEYFKINLKKLEQEKRDMLDNFRTLTK